MNRFAGVTLVTFVLASPAFAHEPEHNHDHGEKLGTVHFSISCKPEAQPLFDRGVALLHSFGYAPAASAFADVLAADPACAMGEWGIAMSYFHEIWAAPTADELAKGSAAAERAVEMGGRLRSRARLHRGHRRLLPRCRDARPPDPRQGVSSRP